MSTVSQLVDKVKGIYDELLAIKEKETSEGENKVDFEKIVDDYRIKNNPTILKDYSDYSKGLYLKMLAAVIRASEDIKDNQTELFAQIIGGAYAGEKDVPEYYKSAMEINAKDYEDFCNYMKYEDLRYRFIVEALIISAMGGYDYNQMILISGLMEALRIDKTEAKYLSLFTKNVLLLGDHNINESKEYIRPESIDIKLFSDYTNIMWYHIDRMITNERYNIIAKKNNNGDYPLIYTENLGGLEKDNNVYIDKKYVSFKNIKTYSYNPYLIFENCELAEFEDCKIQGGRGAITFKNCKEIVFRNCSFEGFRWMTLFCENVKQLYIEDCYFKNCVMTGNYGSGDGRFDDNQSGVIYICKNNTTNIDLKGCTFEDCGGKCNKKTYSGAIICKDANVENCKFYNCWHYHKENEKDEEYVLDPDTYERCLFGRIRNKGGNVVNNSAKLFDDSPSLYDVII